MCILNLLKEMMGLGGDVFIDKNIDKLISENYNLTTKHSTSDGQWKEV